MVFFLAFPMLFGIISVSNSFVPVFFGPGYDEVIELMNVISPIILLIGLSNVIGTQYLLPTKRQKEYTISVVAGAIVNFIMNACLILKFGAVGASIGTIIAEFTVTSIQIFFTRKDFDWKDIFKIQLKYIISSVIMFIVCLAIGKGINNYFKAIIIQIIVGVLIYIITLIAMKDKFVIDILKKLKIVR